MTGIEPAYSAWEPTSTAERVFGNRLVRQATRDRAASRLVAD
jgi:hypothetical protein